MNQSIADLPVDVVDRVLSYLIPPSPPIPEELTAKPLLQRLAFLPPHPDDLDALLSPLPTSRPPREGSPANPLTDVLRMLHRGHVRGPTRYAWDGELFLAKCPLMSDDQSGSSCVDVMFAHENGLASRGWVFHGVTLPDSYALKWSEHAEDVSIDLTSDPGDIDRDADDFWRDFDGEAKEKPGGSDAEGDEANYWQSYGIANDITPGAQTPEMSSPFALANKRSTDHLQDPQATLSKLDASKVPTDDGADKIKSKIQTLLRKAWASWAGDVGDPGQMEERALGWFRHCREATEDETTARETTGDMDVVALTTTAKVLKETMDVFDSSGAEFWQMVEEAVRLPRSLAMPT